MAKPNVLSKLNLVKESVPRSISPVTNRRNKLLLQLQQQRDIAEALLSGKRFVAYKEQHVRDLESGGTKTQKVEKRIKQWFYQSENGTWYMDVRYANRRLAIANGMSAIEIGQAENIIPVIDTLIEATQQHELDEALMKIKSK